MSSFVSSWRRPLFAAAVTAAVLAPASASAAQRTEAFPLPSTQGNVDPSRVKLNKVTSLNATVVLPDGYDADPNKQWPVVYLFAGIGDNHTGWITSGQIPALAKDLPAIVVLPETGRGFLLDWYKPKARAAGAWGSYLLNEVIPAIHDRYRVLPGRQNHAVGGISMGSYGALLLGGQLPGYFGSIVSLSALVDAQSPESAALLPSETGATGYEAIWGPVRGAYASAHNPLKVADNLAGSRVYLHTGNGQVDTRVPFNFDAWTKGAIIETLGAAQNVRYEKALTKAGVDHVFKVRNGVHEWAYWKRELPDALKWGLFEEPKYTSTQAATEWKYKTIAGSGNAWGLGFTFATKPTVINTIARSGLTVSVAGKGKVTINPGAPEWDASGAGTKPSCSFTAELPVSRTLPAECFEAPATGSGPGDAR